MFSKEQQEYRRRFIGASQSAGIMGLDPRNPPIKIYNRMVHGVMDESQSIAAERGTYMEPWIAKKFEEEFADLGVKLVDPKEVWPDTYGSIVHPKIAWLAASLDRYIEGTNEPVEIKDIGDPSVIAEFGQEGSEEVPLKYHIQVMHQLAVFREYCELNGMPVPERGYLYALLRGSILKAFVIPWDESKWREIYVNLEAFMLNNVVAEVPPPVTGDDEYRSFLRQRRAALGFNDNKREDNSEETIALASEIACLQRFDKAVSERLKLLKNQSMAMIGQDKGVSGQYGTLQIISSSPVEKVDHEKAVLGFRDLVPDEKYNEVIRQCTYVAPPKAPHVQLYPKKGWEPDKAIYSRSIALLTEAK